MDASSSLKTVKKAEENLVKVVDALEGGECASVSVIFERRLDD